jgi:hypothetical protein
MEGLMNKITKKTETSFGFKTGRNERSRYRLPNIEQFIREKPCIMFTMLVSSNVVRESLTIKQFIRNI